MLLSTNRSTEYCMYLRKSRLDLEAEAHGQGDTLARHRAALYELAQRMGITITQIYEEVVSGETIQSRPQMKALLRDVEAGRWKGVLCMEVERLARGNTADQGLVADTFKYSNTLIVTPMKVYDPTDEYDEEFFEFGLFRSRMEYRTINRRLQRGREASLREGKYIAGAAPYGYERYKLPKQKGYSLRIIPEQAETVRKIFQWYVFGEVQPDGSTMQLGSFTIAKKLDSLGIPSPSGGKWPACTVKEIITNPTYIGKVRWSYRPTLKQMVDGRRIETRPINSGVPLVDGIHEPIIEAEVWEQAQAILKGRSHSPVPKSSQIRNPLAGLVYCAKCGRIMERRKYQRGRDMMMCPNKDCRMVSAPLEEVETAVLSSLRLWMSDYKVKLARLPIHETQAADDARTEIVRLEQTLSELRKQLDGLYDLVERGVYTDDLFLQRSKVLSEKISETQASLDSAKARLASGLSLRQNHFEIIPKVERVLEVYPTLDDVAEKNALLKGVLDRVVYTKSKGGRWGESDLQVMVFPKIEPFPIS